MTSVYQRLLRMQGHVATLAVITWLSANPYAASGTEYLEIVTSYADALIDHGRDSYGDAHSPLFAAAMDRETMKPGAFPGIEGIRDGGWPSFLNLGAKAPRVCGDRPSG